MSRVCVATSRSRAYFSLVTRLRAAGVPFVSLVPGSRDSECSLVLTTREEAEVFGEKAVPIEELDENPYVLKGQVLSRLDGGAEILLVGVDPGTRIGMAAYYGNSRLEFGTFDSVQALCERAVRFIRGVPARRSLVRIGNGNLAQATRLAMLLLGALPGLAIEVVDEAGTSSRGARIKGVQGDQMAAARIAFRKGAPFDVGPRTRSSLR